MSIVFKMDSCFDSKQKTKRDILSCVFFFFWPIKFPVHVLILFVEKNIVAANTKLCKAFIGAISDDGNHISSVVVERE